MGDAGTGARRAVASVAPPQVERRRLLSDPSTLDDYPLRAAHVLDGGDKVFVLIAFDATNGGKHSFPNNGHLWQFNAAGKAIKYDHITDTAQMIWMARVE